MGSAAAVATGMADIAVGTQTASSITRPASFCGIYGFKPSYGAVPMTGVKLVAPSLDTVGWFARDAGLLDAAHAALTGKDRTQRPSTEPRVAIVRTPSWDEASEDSQLAVLQASLASRERGAEISDPAPDDVLEGLAEAQQVVMGYEAFRSLAWEYDHRDQLSALLAGMLDAGGRMTVQEYDEARRRRDQALARLPSLFRDADVLLAPAAMGEAPQDLSGTGDPLFGRPWSLLGLPTVTVPWGLGSTGMPIGVQAIARPGEDRALLSFARWFEPRIVEPRIVEPQRRGPDPQRRSSP
jgi:Asp-tRNA(Asn)/Glu-tRNA(Gln) amidotransferase A subunit family amidase